MRIQSTGVWFDPVKGCSVAEKTENAIYFPSKAEYNLYFFLNQTLRDKNIKIIAHPKVGVYGRRWAIDFCLESGSPSAATQLATLNNRVNGTNFKSLEKLYIEYKGIQDKNFLSKMQHFCIQAPTLASTIILVSLETSAFGCENGLGKAIILKPIVSVDTFKKWFNDAIVDLVKI